MRNTQRTAILQYLKDGKTLTFYLEAVKLGVSNLSQRVRELKADGHKIETRQKVVKNRYGNMVRIKEYYYKGE